MRALVIADIHGNYPALRAVLAEPYDLLICLGDVVGYGPHPAACVAELRHRRGVMLQGNHDRALAEHGSPRCSPAFRWLAEATAPIAERQLNAAEIAYLGTLPRWARATLEARSYVAVHATPTDPQYLYLGPDADGWEQQAESVDADLILAGHTHLQFSLRTASGVDVVNPGSVGQPKDGDPRAAYAVLEGGQVTLKRAEYDVHETVRALRASATDSAAVDVLATLLVTGSVPAEMPVLAPET